MKNKARWLLLLLIFFGHGPILTCRAVDQDVSNYAVRLSASVQAEPPQILLSWPEAGSATNFQVFRKAKESPRWEAPVSLPADAQSYLDTNVTVGASYEYHVWRAATNYDGHGYILSAIEAPLVESRGKLVLVVDKTYTSSLGAELARLEQDLVGDGWTVLRHEVPRMLISPAEMNPAVWGLRSNEVAAVKSLIRADYLVDPANVRAVFLFGHVPAPYSGHLAPDGHPDHRGAWPADLYYGDMEGTWTDFLVNSTSATDSRNRNVPGDGKFDQNYTPGRVALQVGRVDFAGLPTVPRTELELLRDYLNKDHAFRHAAVAVNPQALINDNFGLLGLEIPGGGAWANFAALVGTNVASGRWLSDLLREPYLWAYGSGNGTYTRAAGVVETSHYLVYQPKVVFAMLFGSYFGDWDSTDNLLRASVAATPNTLAAVWSGRPQWYVHHMALGETIGYSAAVSQNNAGLYQASRVRPSGIGFPSEDPTNSLTGIHIALMGDPSLRMQPVPPPLAFAAVPNPSGAVELWWTPPTNEVRGYHVYRAPAAGGPYTRLNPALLTRTAYADWSHSPERFYMVRSVDLQRSGSGAYYSGSQGLFAQVMVDPGPGDDAAWLGGTTRDWTMTDAAGVAGEQPGWDLQRVDGVLTIAATAGNPLKLRLLSVDEQGRPAPPAHFNRDTAYAWPILAATAPVFGFDPSRIQLVLDGFRADLGGGRFSVALSDDQLGINLVFTPNHPPTASPAVFNRLWDEPLRVRVADLMTQFTGDPDNDPRALVQVGSSTNGTTITSDGVYLVFASTNNWPETVRYWVQDVREYRPGDTVQTASSTIRIDPVPRGAFFSAYHAIEVEWVSEAGQLYQVQSRLETGTPWVNEGPLVVGTGEKMSLFERAATTTKFYRVIAVDPPQPPPTSGGGTLPPVP